MVPPPRAPLRVDRLRAVNTPEAVRVELDEWGLPSVVKRETGSGKRVETVRETWRVDDEWWRTPIARRYYEVVVEGGGRMILYEDLVTQEWFVQTP